MTGAELQALRAHPDENVTVDNQEYVFSRLREREAYVEGYNQAVEDIVKFLRDNLDRYDESIGLTKDEFVIEIYKHINKEQ